MIMKNNKKYEPRAYTNLLLQMVDEGLICTEELVNELLGWLSEDDVEKFAKTYEYIEDEEDEEE